MTAIFFLLLPLWVMLVIDGGIKLLFVGIRLWRGGLSPLQKAGMEQPPTASHFFSLALVVPAHNEEAVIGETVRELRRLRYPTVRYTVIVIADGCTDDTAARAREQGAFCVERAPQREQGKGRALAWLLTTEQERMGAFDIVLVCDADSRLHPDALLWINQAFLDGCLAVQGKVAHDPETSTVGLAVAFPEALSQDIDDYARTALHWPAPLRGTGMAFQRELLTKAAPRLRTKVEDLELSLLLTLEGVPARHVPEAIIHDPKPAEVAGAVRQRARWLQGHGEILRRYWWEMLRIFWNGRRGERGLLFSLFSRPRALVIGAKTTVACLATALIPVASSGIAGVFILGAWVALLADVLYYLAGFLFVVRGDAWRGVWRVIFYVPIWIGAVALSPFTRKKWLSVRNKTVGR